MIPTRLRDFVETREGLLFAVAGYPAARARTLPALLRFAPDPRGPRFREGGNYRKVPASEARRWLLGRHPEYLGPPGDLHRVPLSRVARVLPTRGGVGRCQPEVRRLAGLLGPPGSIGATGSHLCGLAEPGSDVDLVAYGRGYEAARERLRRAVARRELRPLSDREWDRVIEKRRPPLPREEFLLHEGRKGNRAVRGELRFDLLYVRSWSEVRGYRPWRGTPAGARTLRANLLSVERPFDIPTLYRTDHPGVAWVMNFRHDFVDQVRPGELLEARGRLERKGGEARLVVGRPDTPRGEWIRSLSLVEGGEAP
ncbi:MAG: nucleotidyltransferase domain-containing protein [Halobacteria archaeon]